MELPLESVLYVWMERSVSLSVSGCVCVCVCVYACVHACVHVSVHVCVCVLYLVDINSTRRYIGCVSSVINCTCCVLT